MTSHRSLCAVDGNRVFRLSVSQYEQLSEIGVLTPEHRVELLDGLLIKKMTQNPAHSIVLDLVQQAIRAIVTKEWWIREAKPVRLRESEPEPDLAVVKAPATRYAKRHPKKADIGLLIEVADASLENDRAEKGPIYARNGIEQYWIVNVRDQIVEVYTQPKKGKNAGYAKVEEYGLGDTITLILDGIVIGEAAVRDFFP